MIHISNFFVRRILEGIIKMNHISKNNIQLYSEPIFRPNTKMESKHKNKEHFSNLLVNIGKNKDKDSFIEIFEYFAPRIKSYLIKNGSPPEQADELAQETMLNVWNKAQTFNPTKALASTWIFTIARNKKIDAIRNIKKNLPDINDPAFIPEERNAQDKIEKAQNSSIISKAIQKLPDEQSTIIHKSFFEDKSQSEIAKDLNIPLGTVKSRTRLALKKLREDIEQNNKSIKND